jgi:SrtB family sortase
MKAIDLLFRIAHGVLRFVVVLTASLMLIYGAYVIFDTLCVERNAFVSSELLKYKPTVTSVETVEYSMQDLQKINDDVVGWLEIENTHIDYPVVQGEDELEYANKDPFGNHSITGSIYLSSGNDRNFDDFYNVIYGHNMDAGAMFGDIAKYLDKDYFEAHRTGMLYTNDKSYEFKIYAVLETDAYQSNIYSSNVTNKEDSKKQNRLHQFEPYSR